MGKLEVAYLTMLVVLFIVVMPLAALGAIVRAIKKDTSWRKWAGASAKCAVAVVGMYLLGIVIPWPKPTQAADGPSLVPAQFRGTWASDVESCNDFDSRTHVENNGLSFPAMSFEAKSVAAQTPTEITLRGYGVLQGAIETNIVTLRLSPDEQRLMIIVGTPSGDETYWPKCPA